MPATHRSGAVLVVVAGMLAMLVTLAITFLFRMRQDVEEADLILQQTQCRLMLHAGMQFVQESSRLGYARDSDSNGVLSASERAVEAWGWIDVRDGIIGPRDQNGTALYSAGSWPAPGTVKRAPMFRYTRPPFAVVPNMYPNQISDIDDTAVDPQCADTFGIPLLANPDPMPRGDPSFPAFDPGAGTATAQFSAWERGDARPVDSTTGRAWFRVYRETGGEADRPAAAGPAGATFIITVGSGGTLGFKDWTDVQNAGAESQFANDPQLFDSLRAGELRQWYRVAWTGAVGGGELRLLFPLMGGKSGKQEGNAPGLAGRWRSYHARAPVNVSRSRHAENNFSTAEPRNYVGTITYIQRLRAPSIAW